MRAELVQIHMGPEDRVTGRVFPAESGRPWVFATVDFGAPAVVNVFSAGGDYSATATKGMAGALALADQLSAAAESIRSQVAALDGEGREAVAS